MTLISDRQKQRFTQLLDTADAVIHRHHQPSMADELLHLSQTIANTDRRDSYGQGGVVNDFEATLSTLFGKPGSLFLPTGTLAQCAALKCYSEHTGKSGIGLHPTSHLLLHEHNAMEDLWGLSARPIGDIQQVVTVRDVQHLDPSTTAAVVIEAPMREIGGALPGWQTLCDIRDWCDSHNVRLHLDGARIWQATHFYQRALADIVTLFDSVYVSFYKDLGGIFGAALLGEQALTNEVRIWARRAGGNPITLYPEVLAARDGLDRYLPRMPEFVAYTASLCACLRSLSITLLPERPKAAMFHLRLPLDASTLTDKILRYADDTRVIALPLPRSGDQQHCICEISIGDQATAHAPEFWAHHIEACLHC